MNDNNHENDCCVCMEPIKNKIALIPCGHTQNCIDSVRAYTIL